MHREQSVRAQHSHVFDLLRFPANFLYALGQPLDPEEISLRELLRHFAEKRPIAAPKIDMQRRAAPKKLHKIETRDLQFRQYFDHGEKWRHLADASTLGKMRASEGKHLEERRVRSDMKETL